MYTGDIDLRVSVKGLSLTNMTIANNTVDALFLIGQVLSSD